MTSTILLEKLTIAERLKAAEYYYRRHDPRFADGLRHAVDIVAPDGWQHIAPAWVKLIQNGVKEPR
jgi:hypothetical protein